MHRTTLRRTAIGAALGLGLAAPLTAALASGSRAPVASFRAWTVTAGHNSAAVHGGEPSIGYDPKLNAVIYGASAHETRMVFHQRGGSTSVTQTDVTAPTAATTFDAITFVDQRTGRLFDSQLLTACSAMSYSDDAGANWTPSEGCGPNALLDHQSVGGGPFHAPLPKAGVNPTYPDAVYYCAQNGFNGNCAVSLDGGRTFGPGVPISNTPANKPGDPFGGRCSGLHGHLKVGPDGTVYVPIKGCGGTPTAGNLTNQEFFGGEPAVSVSTDDGATYTVHSVPGGHNGDESENAGDIDRGNQVWMAWQDAKYPVPTDDTKLPLTSSARVAFSKDDGTTWSKPVDLSSKLGLHNVQFPEVVAGDKGRVAVAFLGTRAVGDDQHNGFRGFDGKPAVWDLYVALTYDNGRHWTTLDTTPSDPVQRGCVDLQGISNKTITDNNICRQRNLLDFNDITMDKYGRVLVAYADGCTGKCVTDKNAISRDDVDMVMRLQGGKGLVAKYDGKLGPASSSRSSAPLALGALLAAPIALVRRRRSA
jgi:hypothetical protein